LFIIERRILFRNVYLLFIEEKFSKAKRTDGKGDWSKKPEDWNLFIRKVAKVIE
jgi:hypothetical protein